MYVNDNCSGCVGFVCTLFVSSSCLVIYYCWLNIIIYTNANIFGFLRMYVCITLCIHTYIHMHVCTYVATYIHTYIRIRNYTTYS